MAGAIVIKPYTDVSLAKILAAASRCLWCCTQGSQTCFFAFKNAAIDFQGSKYDLNIVWHTLLQCYVESHLNKFAQVLMSYYTILLALQVVQFACVTTINQLTKTKWVQANDFITELKTFFFPKNSF